METIKEINLNVSQPNNFQLIHAMQGSLNSIKVIAHLYDGNKPYVIPDTVSEYQLLGVLPSGKYLMDDQLSKYDDHSVTFLINQNMMAKAGYVQFSISLVDADDTAITETFPAKIMVTAIPGQNYEQVDEIPIVTKSLQEVKRNKEKAEEAAEKSENAYQNLISEKGQPNGIASLDEDGKLPLSQLSVLKDTILTGVPKAPTASAGTNTEQIATTAFVQTSVSEGIAASDALIFKGTIGTNGTVTTLPTTYKTGWTYRVVTDGTYAEQACEIGDLIIALVDRNGSENENTDWCVAQTNIDGAITEIKNEDAYIHCSQSGSVITISHKDASRTDTSTTARPSAGGTFTAIKSLNSDTKGHITGVETETVTLPSLDATGLGFVSIEASQGLSDEKKENARDNISAVNKNGDTITGNLIGSAGGQFAIDGNVYLKSQGYDNWLTNYLEKYSTPRGSFTGNVDSLHTTRDSGAYWIAVANATGTHPSNSTYYSLIVESVTDNLSIQIAAVHNGDGAPPTMYVRSRVNSTWQPWGKIADGGNADTVDGLHASNFFRSYAGWGATIFNTHDVNEWAKSGCYDTIGGQALNLPSGTDGWGTILVWITASGAVQVYYGWNDTNKNLWYRANYGGWGAWRRLATTGTDGILPVSNGGTGKSSFTSGSVLIGNGTNVIAERAIDSSSYGGTDNSTSLITSGAVAKGKVKIAAYGKNKSESISLDQNFKYVVIATGSATSTKTESITLYYYDSSWKSITLIGNGMPGISISGNIMSITYNESASSYRQTSYAVIKML